MTVQTWRWRSPRVTWRICFEDPEIGRVCGDVSVWCFGIPEQYLPKCLFSCHTVEIFFCFSTHVTLRQMLQCYKSVRSHQGLVEHATHWTFYSKNVIIRVLLGHFSFRVVPRWLICANRADLCWPVCHYQTLLRTKDRDHLPEPHNMGTDHMTWACCPWLPHHPPPPFPLSPGGAQLWPLWEPSQTFRSSRHVLWHLTFDLPHVCEEAGSRPSVCLVTWPLIGCPASSIGSPKPMTAGATVNYSVLLAGNTAYWKPVKSFTSNHDVLILVLLCGCKAFNLINCVFLSQVLN